MDQMVNTKAKVRDHSYTLAVPSADELAAQDRATRTLRAARDTRRMAAVKPGLYLAVLFFGALIASPVMGWTFWLFAGLLFVTAIVVQIVWWKTK